MAEDFPMPTVSQVDLPRYLGLWYEICRLPMKWEDEAASDITAHYSLKPDGRVKVDNRCLDADGKPAQAVGEAQAVDDSMARLTVTFLPAGLRWLPFTKGDYWVLMLDDDYRIALAGSPDRKYLWLLSRTAQLSPADRAPFLAYARELGFDLTPLIIPRQSGGQVTDAMLERAEAAG